MLWCHCSRGHSLCTTMGSPFSTCSCAPAPPRVTLHPESASAPRPARLSRCFPHICTHLLPEPSQSPVGITMHVFQTPAGVRTVLRELEWGIASRTFQLIVPSSNRGIIVHGAEAMQKASLNATGGPKFLLSSWDAEWTLR